MKSLEDEALVNISVGCFVPKWSVKENCCLEGDNGQSDSHFQYVLCAHGIHRYEQFEWHYDYHNEEQLQIIKVLSYQ